MLSAVPNAAPSHGVSMRDQQSYLPLDPRLSEDRLCPGCKKSAVNQNGGLVVAFGQSFFHVDCFKCAKCGDQVTADTNLLLLSDGSPICANCSYSCNVCRLPILDEAIMTGDDSYHAHCFKCKVCKNRIDELVFAKTSQGIYCMNCHSERMAKIRRHAQKKAERAEKEKERSLASTISQSKSSSETTSTAASSSTAVSSMYSPALKHLAAAAAAAAISSPAARSTPPTKRKSLTFVSDAFYTSSPAPTPSLNLPQQQQQQHQSASPPMPSLSSAWWTTTPPSPPSSHPYASAAASTSSFTAPPISPLPSLPPPPYSSPAVISVVPLSSSSSSSQSTPFTTNASPAAFASTLTSPPPAVPDRTRLSPVKFDPDEGDDVVGGMRRRKSFDDGVRPLHLLLPQTRPAPSGHSDAPANKRVDYGSNISSSSGSNGVSNVRSGRNGGSGSGGGSGDLSVPGSGTSRSNKRNSINPVLFSPEAIFLASETTLAASPTSSPLPSSSPLPPPHSDPATPRAESSQSSSPGSSANSPPFSSPSTLRLSNSSSGGSHDGGAAGVGVGVDPPAPSKGDGAIANGISIGGSSPSSRDSASSTGTFTTRRGAAAVAAGTTLDVVPPRSTSLSPAVVAPTTATALDVGSGGGSALRTTVTGTSTASRSRPASPARRADVPRSVESGTDTEAEAEGEAEGEASGVEGGVGPKDALGTGPGPEPGTLELGTSASAENSDVEDVSPAEERTSHATFIAPALLPPIRFSMNQADFSEMLNGVNLGAGKAPTATSAAGSAAALKTKGVVSPSTPPAPVAPESLLGRQIQCVSEREAAGLADAALGSSSISEEQSKLGGGPSTTTITESIKGSVATQDGTFSSDHHSHNNHYASSSDGHGYGHVSNQSLVLSTTFQSDPAPLLKRSNTTGSQRGPKGTGRQQYQHRQQQQQQRGQTAPEPSLSSGTAVDTSSQQSHGSAHSPSSAGRVIELDAAGAGAGKPSVKHRDHADLIRRRLHEALLDANERGLPRLKIDKGFLEAMLAVMERRSAEFVAMKGEIDGMKRASMQYIDGLSVAQTEYDRELKARRDAEAEVTRLRVLLSGQAAQLTAISGENTRQEHRKQMSKELSDTLEKLQREIARLKTERDMTVAEMDELTTSKSAARSNNSDLSPVQLGRSLTMRLDNIKAQYLNELLPLKQQCEAHSREVAELKGVRDVLLEETTALNARNEELAKLSALYSRRIDGASSEALRAATPVGKQSASFDRPRQPQLNAVTAMLQSVSPNINGSFHSGDEPAEMKIRVPKPEPEAHSKPKFIKWPGSKPKESAAKENTLPSLALTSENGRAQKMYREHIFQHLSILRFTRCDHCGDKMWGSQLRCSTCSLSIHVRCVQSAHASCSPQNASRGEDSGPQLPSIFGRDLAEQVRADAQGSDRMVPLIVEKCIEAVEASGMDYEGIYRKTGGSGQSKAITQLFERGDYSAFDLRDSDRFTDICSVTSVLKTYFRSLPVPLLSYDLHDAFIAAAQIKDTIAKAKALSDLVKKLPSEHYHTLRMLMLHLNRVRDQSETNRMNARNLGVVFGPTLMRSPDPAAEFSDMAGKALSIEWLVENASTIFNATIPSS